MIVPATIPIRRICISGACSQYLCTFLYWGQSEFKGPNGLHCPSRCVSLQLPDGPRSWTPQTILIRLLLREWVGGPNRKIILKIFIWSGFRLNNENRRNPGLLPETSTVLFSPGGILEGETGPDSQRRHIRGGEPPVEHGIREYEVDLIGLQLVVRIQSRDVSAVIKAVRVAHEKGARGGRGSRLLGLED